MRTPISVRVLLAAALLASPVLAAGGKAPVLVSPDWLAAHLKDPDVVVLHVAMAHDGAPKQLVPGARLLDYHAITEDRGGLPVEMPSAAALARAFGEAGVSNGKHVVLYGEGPPHMAARAFVALDYLGHGERTSVLDGGLEAWRAAGLPTSDKPASGPAGSFEPRVRAELLVSAEWIAARLNDPKTVLVDARPASEYSGERKQPGLRGGHIPGAYNLYFMDLVVSTQEPRLGDLDAVRRRFAEAGAQAGATVVSYCYIGMRASYTYLVARHLGYDARFYDPSWAEWGRRDDLPLAVGDSRR